MISELISQFDLYVLLVILHIVGTAIGAGGATLSDILFFKSIEDGRINRYEFSLMQAGGLAVWGGLMILIFSGVSMVLYQYYVDGVSVLEASSKLQAKIVIVTVILLNGIFLHTKIFPLFKKSLDQDVTKELFLNHASIIFASGAVSAVSWYSALIIGAWRGLSASPYIILAVYFFVLTCGVIAAQIIGKLKVAQIKKKLAEKNS